MHVVSIPTGTSAPDLHTIISGSHLSAQRCVPGSKCAPSPAPSRPAPVAAAQTRCTCAPGRRAPCSAAEGQEPFSPWQLSQAAKASCIQTHSTPSPGRHAPGSVAEDGGHLSPGSLSSACTCICCAIASGAQAFCWWRCHVEAAMSAAALPGHLCLNPYHQHAI